MERAGGMYRISDKELTLPMKLKRHGAFLVNFVMDFANGDMSRWVFDMDYSGYVIEHFPEFEKEHPRLSQRLRTRLNVPIPPAPG